MRQREKNRLFFSQSPADFAVAKSRLAGGWRLCRQPEMALPFDEMQRQ